MAFSALFRRGGSGSNLFDEEDRKQDEILLRRFYLGFIYLSWVVDQTDH